MGLVFRVEKQGPCIGSWVPPQGESYGVTLVWTGSHHLGHQSWCDWRPVNEGAGTIQLWVEKDEYFSCVNAHIPDADAWALFLEWKKGTSDLLHGSRQSVKAEDNRADRQIAAEATRTATQQEIETDRAGALMLQVYMDRISELMIEEGLGGSEVTPQASTIARSLTLNAFRELDPPRKTLVMQFLRDSLLVLRGDKSVITFYDADMNGLDLSHVDMRSINLVFANLREADLTGADRRDTDMSCALLLGADLEIANMSRPDIDGPRDPFPGGSRPAGMGANLQDADLSGAIMRRANLSGGNLRGANLSAADLRAGTNWSNEQLAKASSLVNATMPDGSMMTRERWEEFNRTFEGDTRRIGPPCARPSKK